MIKLVRLDYRLLHGQVVFAWTGYVNAQRIIIVDDDAANDEMRKSILKLSKPAGVKLNIFTLKQTLDKIDKIETLKENTMMIFGSTKLLLNFLEVYPKIESVNYGGLANRKGTTQYGSAIFMTNEEVENTKKIIDLGVKIFMQQTPTQKIEDLNL